MAVQSTATHCIKQPTASTFAPERRSHVQISRSHSACFDTSARPAEPVSAMRRMRADPSGLRLLAAIDRLRPYMVLWRSHTDLYLLGLAAFFFMLCTYLTCVSNSYVDRINPNNLLPRSQRKTLLDPGMKGMFGVFEQTGLPRNISDLFVRLSAALVIGRSLSLRERSVTVLRRMLFIGGMVYLLRAPTVIMTVLPNPLLECEANPYHNIGYDALMLMLQQRMSCGDVFFSGHSIFFVLAGRVWITYTENIIIRLMAGVFSIICLFSLVFTSYHYSIDVFIATLIISTLYSIYHWVLRIEYFHNTWYGRVILFVDHEHIMDQEALPCRPSVVNGSIDSDEGDDDLHMNQHSLEVMIHGNNRFGTSSTSANGSREPLASSGFLSQFSSTTRLPHQRSISMPHTSSTDSLASPDSFFPPLFLSLERLQAQPLVSSQQQFTLEDDTTITSPPLSSHITSITPTIKETDRPIHSRGIPEMMQVRPSPFMISNSNNVDLISSPPATASITSLPPQDRV